MLQRTFRLKKNYQFSYIYKRGQRVWAKQLSLYFAKGGKGIKIGFSVSNKIGKAVVRNLVKRRLRAIVSARIDGFPLGYSYIFSASPSIAQCGFTELESEVDSLLARMQKAIANKAK